MGLSVGLASWSGETAEDTVKGINGISESQMERHEESAEIAEVICFGLAAISGITFLAWNTRYRTVGLVVVLGTAVAATVALGYTAHQGGLIRHTELTGLNTGTGYQN